MSSLERWSWNQPDIDLRLPSIDKPTGREAAELRKQERLAVAVEGVRHRVQTVRNGYAAEQVEWSMLLLDRVGRVEHAVSGRNPQVQMHAEMMLDALGAGYVARVHESLQ